ncbi:MAG: ankyrin repeat domain-containing protein [Phycisphaerae bacterium]
MTALVAFACLVTIAAPVAWGFFTQIQKPRLRKWAVAAPFVVWSIAGLVFLVLSWPKITFFRAVAAGELDAVKSGLRTHPEWLTAHELSLDRNTPLGVAVRAGREEVVAWLLEKGAPLNPDVNVPPLVLAASRGRTAIGRMLLECGASPDQVGFRHDNPAIAIAAWFGHPRFVRLLIDGGAEIEATDIGGDTALMDASKRGQVECVEVLLDAGADVNASNRFAETALHQAARNGHAADLQQRQRPRLSF